MPFQCTGKDDNLCIVFTGSSSRVRLIDMCAGHLANKNRFEHHLTVKASPCAILCEAPFINSFLVYAMRVLPLHIRDG